MTKLSLTDGVVTCCCLGVLLLLVAPTITASQERTRLDECSLRLKKLGAAILQRESATGTFPFAMFGPPSDTERFISSRGPDLPLGNGDGYSWITTLLPYLEGMDELDEELKTTSRDYSEWITSKKLKRKDGSRIYKAMVPAVVCPSSQEKHAVTRFKGPSWLEPSQVSSYLAITAGCVEGSRGIFATANRRTGGMLVTMDASEKGMRLVDCRDGTSNTVMLGETKAEWLNPWMSGAGTSTVATPPSLVKCRNIMRHQPDGHPAVPDGISSSLDYGRDYDAPKSDKSPWFAEGFFRRRNIDWGTSSRHKGGLVTHVLADGHTKTFSKETDPTVYFRMATRAGSEAIKEH